MRSIDTIQWNNIVGRPSGTWLFKNKLDYTADLSGQPNLNNYLLSSTYASQSGQFILLSAGNTLGNNFSLNGNVKLNGNSLNQANGLVKLVGSTIPSSLIPSNFLTKESDPIYASQSGQFVLLSAGNTLGNNFSLNGNVKLNGNSLNQANGLVKLDPNGKISFDLYESIKHVDLNESVLTLNNALKNNTFTQVTQNVTKVTFDFVDGTDIRNSVCMFHTGSTAPTVTLNKRNKLSNKAFPTLEANSWYIFVSERNVVLWKKLV